ncbi:hypothetical protein M5W76_18045 [Paenibacillus larvae]|uniref:Uncharacterized protein n=6 Tax=Fernvirus TaxID=2843380 RepID=A0A2I7SCX2_9CAUD|nr:hypothetical protein [Paenibacillus larvae]YP_009836302.1 hypothetical protein HWB43_gp45 [Paenibacillus phage BN12]YP_009836451.1 hypothetical protein HWB45_gp42 [Paenibacillus phage Pagassa]YP_009836519.1 hypothetical protein HWB46_gp40 [Paenibacillus phage Tadhana]YP_009838736.1 hypothetical protein HWB71_gp36 [Paenibacillus phage Kawika]YP_009838873.1 hypothetical protein HWB73_gp37 [Paenibacillus phage Eltigre]AXF39597.1 hypothetical protein HONEYBEAR_38 [Paenibacillus phage Honeybear
MNKSDLASVKRHLEQLKARLNKINSYQGWLSVRTDDDMVVLRDLLDSELRALIKRKLEDSIKFCEEQLKKHENEPKS